MFPPSSRRRNEELTRSRRPWLWCTVLYCTALDEVELKVELKVEVEAKSLELTEAKMASMF
jgi:hypothetical protein